jgi:uncharacterized protein (TIGR04255 family)
MTAVTLNLRNPPIVEAVLDIDCDLEPKFSLLDIEASSRDALRQSYPKLRKQLLQELKLEATSGGITDKSTNSTLQALQFLQDDELQIVQIRRGGYSFNRLAPYASLDDYLPEIRRSWELYRGIAKPVQVRAVQLRYINRIQLPMSDGAVNLDDYFKSGPKLPENSGLAFSGFLNQSLAVETNTGFQVNTVLTAEAARDDKLPVIFDISAKADRPFIPDDWPTLERTLQGLRGLKNRVFQNTLTDKCLSLFQ